MIAPADVRTVTVADRPDLAAGIPAVLSSRWPAFMLAGHPGHGVDLFRVLMEVPDHQVLLIQAADDEILGAGLSIPMSWDGTTEGLPAGWDGAVAAGGALHEHGGRANTATALSITMTPAATGRGLAGRLLDGLIQAAADAGARALIAPVRPVLKTRYPLIPMERYLTWRTDDGRIFDPWLRLHLERGGQQGGTAFPSMTITGCVSDWQEWLDLPLPDSGEYVIPGGLVPLVVDRETDTCVYREPNIWVVHPTRR